MKKLALLVAIAMTGCTYVGAPRAGAKCSKTWVPECVTLDVVAYCEDEKWVDYACPSECRNLQATRCDWLQAREAEVCPLSFEGHGFCTAAGTAFVCLSGRWQAVTCAECTADAAANPLIAPRPSCRP